MELLVGVVIGINLTQVGKWARRTYLLGKQVTGREESRRREPS